MKTLTVRLPEALVLEIEHESRARRVSKSDVVRERLSQPQGTSPGGATMTDLIGDVLEASWEAAPPSKTIRFGSAQKKKLAEMIRAKKLHR